jgi:hypothetical protein
MKKNKSKLKSNCCNSAIRYSEMTPDFIGDNPKEMKIGTVYYICIKCGEACDIHINERKFWTRNPKTQIIGDKREKKKRKQTEKEIKENK